MLSLIDTILSRLWGLSLAATIFCMTFLPALFTSLDEAIMWTMVFAKLTLVLFALSVIFSLFTATTTMAIIWTVVVIVLVGIAFDFAPLGKSFLENNGKQISQNMGFVKDFFR